MLCRDLVFSGPVCVDKQQTAYEVRISDWGSDVCSSDLPARVRCGRGTMAELGGELEKLGCDKVILVTSAPQSEDADRLREQIGGACAGVFKRAARHTPTDVTQEIGRASCRERVCQYV